MKLRTYQTESIDSVNLYLREKGGNPCIVLPTGAGKSFVMAEMIRQWVDLCPQIRVCVLAHRSELVAQNHDELHNLAPGLDLGIYAATLKRRDTDAQITFAMIDSIFNKFDKHFLPFDVIVVDEAHRIPVRGEGKYRQFISECQSKRPELRVVGLTATPYRLDSGPICHDDFILTDVCYEANVGDLIKEGYLCPIRAKIQEQPDLSSVRKNSKGDYVSKALAETVDVPVVVERAIAEAVQILVSEKRRSVLFFCVNQAHCEHVSKELKRHHVHAPIVTAKTPLAERERIVSDFKAGKIHALCNIDVYTEGFNAKQVDAVVMLRPTLSKGLYSQIVGRGLRLHPDKADCLILDYAGNIEEHGPIDMLDAGDVKIAKCGACGDAFAFALKQCPNCDWQIPKREIEIEDRIQAERRLHDAMAAQAEILGSKPVRREVHDVRIHRHKKDGAKDSVRVEYRCGLEVFREWVCLDHLGNVGDEARQWWHRRFRENAPSVDSAIESSFDGIFLNELLTQTTIAIWTVKKGKYHEIFDHELTTDIRSSDGE